jgi:hypothetical protein
MSNIDIRRRNGFLDVDISDNIYGELKVIEIMEDLGYLKIYDSRNIRLEWVSNKIN